MSKQKTNFCTQHVLILCFSCNSMKNLSSYCGLTDARMRAFENDLPVLFKQSLCKEKFIVITRIKSSRKFIFIPLLTTSHHKWSHMLFYAVCTINITYIHMSCDGSEITMFGAPCLGPKE